MYSVTIWNSIPEKPRFFWTRKGAIKYITDYYFPNDLDAEEWIYFKNGNIYDCENYWLGKIEPTTNGLHTAITVFNLTVATIGLVVLFKSLIDRFG